MVTSLSFLFSRPYICLDIVASYGRSENRSLNKPSVWKLKVYTQYFSMLVRASFKIMTHHSHDSNDVH